MTCKILKLVEPLSCQNLREMHLVFYSQVNTWIYSYANLYVDFPVQDDLLSIPLKIKYLKANFFKS